jgi:sulfur-oxidizing protein SoxY
MRRADRRRLLAGIAAAAAGLMAGPAGANSWRNRLSLFRRAFPAPPDRAEAEQMVEVVIAGRPLRDGLVSLSAPDIAENGEVVPFTVAVRCAMTEAEHPRVVHVFAMDNPYPEVARLYFGPENGSAEVEMRCRMRKSSELVAVADMSDGSVGKAVRFVNVTAGACS